MSFTSRSRKQIEGQKTLFTARHPLPSQVSFPLHRRAALASERLARQNGLTFHESRRLGVHRWYPYVEGFSASYVGRILERERPIRVYDPFGGSGTTQLTASLQGIDSFYSEVNPFMTFVAETKVKGSRWARRHFVEFSGIVKAFKAQLANSRFDRLAKSIDLAPYRAAFPDRDFFNEVDLRHLLAAKELASEAGGGKRLATDVLLLACAANVVRSSNMTRRADLRRRRPDEYKTRVVDVRGFIGETIDRMIRDIEALPTRMGGMARVSNDARLSPPAHEESFDLAITSPPYLNGTNYFRNTKLELWFLGYIESEKELSALHGQALAAGINSVRRHRNGFPRFDEVEAVAERLDCGSGDKRIPLLVRQYFGDMANVLQAVHRSLIPDGLFVMDIGDSKFYGVHVPTDMLLAVVGQWAGFAIESHEVIAQRYSRDKSKLVQAELVFRKRTST